MEKGRWKRTGENKSKEVSWQCYVYSLVNTGVGGCCRRSLQLAYSMCLVIFLLTHSCCYQQQQPEFSYHQDAAMSKNSVYMGDSDAATSKFAEKLNSLNFIQHLASASGLQRISIHTGVWMPVTASETPVSTTLTIFWYMKGALHIDFKDRGERKEYGECSILCCSLTGPCKASILLKTSKHTHTLRYPTSQ